MRFYVGRGGPRVSVGPIGMLVLAPIYAAYFFFIVLPVTTVRLVVRLLVAGNAVVEGHRATRAEQTQPNDERAVTATELVRPSWISIIICLIFFWPYGLYRLLVRLDISDARVRKVVLLIASCAFVLLLALPSGHGH